MTESKEEPLGRNEKGKCRRRREDVREARDRSEQQLARSL